MLVLEELEHAKARNAEILGEIVGYGMTCDAYHLTAPDPEGDGAARAMKIAMGEAGITPDQIDYLNAHGTSTEANDVMETKAIKAAFGAHAYKLKVSSTKSMTSHLVAAAGAVEAIVSMLAIRDSFIPCTLNLTNPDPSVILITCRTSDNMLQYGMHSASPWASEDTTEPWCSPDTKREGVVDERACHPSRAVASA